MIVHGSKVISVWAYWVVVIVLSRPPLEQSVQDFSTRYENFDVVFIICLEKLIDRLETKMTDVDPSIVGQHVRPLKNNYFKAWMEYLSKVKKFVLHKGYTEVLSDLTAVEEKLENLFLKEKHSARKIVLTDYFEFKWILSHVCNLSFQRDTEHYIFLVFIFFCKQFMWWHLHSP